MKKVARVLGTAEINEALESRLDDIERRLERLRSLYESFFMGSERVPPNIPRRDLNRLIVEMQQERISNATLRFRFQSLLQRWVLLTTYWNRTLREIESGTFRRDLAKAHRHLSAQGGAMTEEDALRLGIPASRVKSFVKRQQYLAEKASARAAGTTSPPLAGQPVAPAPASPIAPERRPATVTESVPGLAAGQLEAFYEKYVDAHTRATGARPTASLDELRRKLQKQIPVLLADKGCSRVDLDVAIEGDKVRLRARPVR